MQVLKNKPGSLTVEHHLANFLPAYRSTPHTMTGVSPAELFLEHQQCNRLSVVKPNPETVMHQKQQQQQQAHDHNTKRLRSFLPGDAVTVRLLRGREKWAQGEVIQRLGSGSNQQQGQPCPHQSPCGGHGRPHSATHSWQWPLPKPPLGPRVQMLRCITLHTPLTLPQRCCSLCQKSTHQ